MSIGIHARFCVLRAIISHSGRADRLASTADITSSLQLGRSEVLRGLRNFLNIDRPEHHSIDHLKGRGVEKGSIWHSTLQGRERSVVNQTDIGTVSRATLGRLLRDEAECIIMSLSECYNAILKWNWNCIWQIMPRAFFGEGEGEGSTHQELLLNSLLLNRSPFCLWTFWQ